MKQLTVFAAAAIIAILLLSCKKEVYQPLQQNSMVQTELAEKQTQAISLDSVTWNVPEEQAAAICSFLIQRFGERDGKTGFAYIFEVTGYTEVNGERCFIGRWRWMVEDENGRPSHPSAITEFIINETVNEMYAGSYPSADTFEWNPERNLLS